MKKGTTLSQRTRHLEVAEAKPKWSAVVREAGQGPTVIQNRGKELVVVLAIERDERLAADQQAPKAGGAAFLQRIEALKQRLGDGVDDFEPARLDFVPSQPFCEKMRRSDPLLPRHKRHFRNDATEPRRQRDPLAGSTRVDYVTVSWGL